MVDRSDISAVADAASEQAVAREAVIRRLASKASPNRSEFLKACRDLGLKRSRVYELLSAYKARPVASSLLAAQVGTPTGSRRLPVEIELVISGAIEEFYKSLQKPSINALQKEVRRRCSQRGLRPPCWTTLRDRVAAIGPAELTAAREGGKAPVLTKLVRPGLQALTQGSQLQCFSLTAGIGRIVEDPVARAIDVLLASDMNGQERVREALRSWPLSLRRRISARFWRAERDERAHQTAEKAAGQHQSHKHRLIQSYKYRYRIS